MKTQSKQIEERAGRLLSLNGKVAMVTGAASGIGRAIAIRLAEMGAFVAVVDIDEVKGREAESELEGKGIFLKCDVRSAADCRRAVERTIREFGALHILFNNAGIIRRASVVEHHESSRLRPLAAEARRQARIKGLPGPTRISARHREQEHRRGGAAEMMPGGASFSLQRRLQPASSLFVRHRLKPTPQAKARATA